MVNNDNILVNDPNLLGDKTLYLYSVSDDYIIFLALLIITLWLFKGGGIHKKRIFRIKNMSYRKA